MTKKGFTLLELMIAIVLFAGATVPILLALNQGLFATLSSEHRQIAVGLALNEMERLESLAFQGWNNLTTMTKAAISNFTTFQREVLVSNPPGTNANLKEVRVNVYWTDQQESSVTLVTYFVNNPNGSP